MIGYLKGEILENTDGKMTVGIGDGQTIGFVGYSVSIPQSAAYGIFRSGQKVELFVYTHVREDVLDLYGFSSKFEKEFFLILLGVNGIGPKSALGILSAAEPADLAAAIVRGDQAFLTRIPGIGKKTAERVVVELRDVLKKKMDTGALSFGSAHPIEKQRTVYEELKGSNSDAFTDVFNDAKAALIGLGYRESDIHSLLIRVMSNSPQKPQRTEDLIRTALRQLA